MKNHIQISTAEDKNQDAFKELVRPLMKWLAENAHPHTKIIIESNCAEMVEGINCVKTDEYLVD